MAKACLRKKPAAVVSVTPGALGAFGANHHLRQSLVFLDMPALQQPEVYIGGVAKLLNEQGEVSNEDTQEAAAAASWMRLRTGSRSTKASCDRGKRAR